VRIVYKSPLIIFLILRMFWSAFIVISVGMMFLAARGEHLIVVVGALIFLISVTLFLKTVRVVIHPDHVKIVGVVFRRRLPYSSMKWSAQVPLLASRPVIIRLRSRMPYAFYLYPTSYFSHIGALLNLDVHGSVEYINTRISASG